MKAHVHVVDSSAHIGFLFYMLALTFSTIPTTLASEFRCNNGYARIIAADLYDQVLICEAAERTIGFLGSIGIESQDIVDIEIVDQEHLNRPETVGCYDWDTDRVLLLPSEKCTALLEAGPYAALDRDELYIGFVAHEISHAVISRALEISDPTAMTQEYISAVVQIGVMLPSDRTKFLNQFAGDGFNESSEINTLVYLIDPARFAAQAHRHFMKPGNGEAFVQALLSGQIVLQDPFPY